MFTSCIQSGYSSADPVPTMEQPLEMQANFYYYVDGKRALLTPSLEWVAVRFVPAEPDSREAALQPYAGQLGGLEEIREIPAPALTLLPLSEGTSLPDLLYLLQAMRADDQSFMLANPLFETETVWMGVADQFIAGFSAELSRAEIDALNAPYGVEVVDAISGQENVYLLRTGPGSGLDALTAANLYQESGLAIHAAPNFIRITK